MVNCFAEEMIRFRVAADALDRLEVTYSPLLDPYGNSVRGIEVCVDLAGRLGLHVFDCLNMGSSFLDAVLNPSTA